MKTLPIRTVALAASLTAAGCLNADLRSNQICASAPEQIPALPQGSGTIRLPPITIDLSSALPDLTRAGVSGTVLVQQLELASTNVDLSGIQKVDATVVGGGHGSSLPPVALTCNYHEPQNPPLPLTAITVPCSGPNVFEYVRSEQLTLEITLTSTSLPATSWTASVGACVSAEILVDYTKL